MYRTLHSLRRRRLVVVTGGSGAGKSALATAIVRHQAIRRLYAEGVVFLACPAPPARPVRAAARSI
eukprot:2530400-Prymnesium_polylepis.1